jgi:hypothetical protein
MCRLADVVVVVERWGVTVERVVVGIGNMPKLF